MDFYTRWMHGDEEAGREIIEASLDPLNPQTELADALLDLFRDLLMTDPAYVARLARPYDMFKRVQPAQAPTSDMDARPGARLSCSPPAPLGRNDPCPGGSGKEYQKCCGMNRRFCLQAPKYRLRPSSRDVYCALFSKRTMRRPKGIKTKKSVAKRFKITATGQVLRSHAGKRHLLQTKSAKRRRGLRGTGLVHQSDVHRIKESLPFSH